jgi:hypothetical protein
MQTGCNGEHAVSVHKLLGEESASVNLVAEDECESEEDEEWWVEWKRRRRRRRKKKRKRRRRPLKK